MSDHTPTCPFDHDSCCSAECDCFCHSDLVTASLVAAENELCDEGDRLMRSIDGSTP